VQHDQQQGHGRSRGVQAHEFFSHDHVSRTGNRQQLSRALYQRQQQHLQYIHNFTPNSLRVYPPSMLRLIVLVSLSMLAFAGNSLLCRLALKQTGIDPISFTAIRLISGAAVLYLLSRARRHASAAAGSQASWTSALALFAYALAFSLAYVGLTAATGALLLFAAVQASMVGYGQLRGERLAGRQWLGLAVAMAGVVFLLLPGLQSPPWSQALLMLLAGLAWGVYSLRGRGAVDPLGVTAGNFVRAVPMALAAAAAMLALHGGGLSVDRSGLAYALASGAIASGLGYTLWYSVLPQLKASAAATLQLSVPAIATLGGVLLLGEALNARLLLASLAILGGIVLVIVRPRS